ncbi:hypothetical protein A6302_04130 [Methylobrevis pamukkalensis]|uniref:Uncharacterized protein n=1 Tax=Methylobrevis pamukkalensis TaxID=1439726 RepID=A0A1E3GWZ4_9HYPH|nr:hypothetical protein A6302_04130 [Methylobrevis pamukkalensis]
MPGVGPGVTSRTAGTSLVPLPGVGSSAGGAPSSVGGVTRRVCTGLASGATGASTPSCGRRSPIFGSSALPVPSGAVPWVGAGLVSLPARKLSIWSRCDQPSAARPASTTSTSEATTRPDRLRVVPACASARSISAEVRPSATGPPAAAGTTGTSSVDPAGARGLPPRVGSRRSCDGDRPPDFVSSRDFFGSPDFEAPNRGSAGVRSPDARSDGVRSGDGGIPSRAGLPDASPDDRWSSRARTKTSAPDAAAVSPGVWPFGFGVTTTSGAGAGTGVGGFGSGFGAGRGSGCGSLGTAGFGSAGLGSAGFGSACLAQTPAEGRVGASARVWVLAAVPAAAAASGRIRRPRSRPRPCESIPRARGAGR